MPLDSLHVKRLIEHSIKFDQETLIFTVEAPRDIETLAGVIFLETGNSKAGWEHLKKHLNEFEAFGLEERNFCMLLEAKLATVPHHIGTPSGGKGTLATYVVDAGKGNFDLNIVIAQNGFVVTAHPYEMTASSYYGAIRNSGSLGLAGYSIHQ
jgi:hypothetical protein